jgi:hypothetical protein
VAHMYDLIAVGAGPAGESATELASFFGLRCAVVEKDRPGGTVTTTGGAPTKTLREAALFVSGYSDSDVYGLRMTVPPELAMDVIRTRTWGVCSQLQDLTKKNILARVGSGSTTLGVPSPRLASRAAPRLRRCRACSGAVSLADDLDLCARVGGSWARSRK